MRLFKKETSQFAVEDVSATQDVVQAITTALKNGAEQQDFAAKRLADLAKTMNKLDVNARQSKRLEVEVERMDSELATLRGDLEKKRAWAQEQTAKLVTVQKERAPHKL